jgi:hypothetical protein
MPYTDIELPKRLKLHSEKDEPRCKKSMTDSDDPKLVIPYTENVDPRRPKLRNESDEPK